MSTSTNSIVSVGRAASQLLCAPGLFTQAATELDIAPNMTINGIPHYATEDLDAIGERVRVLQQQTHNRS